MKKIILCLVALLIALGLSACGKDLPSGNTPSAPDTSDVDNKVDVTDPDKDAPKGDGKDDADADKKDTPCDHKGLKYRVAKAATCTVQSHFYHYPILFPSTLFKLSS